MKREEPDRESQETQDEAAGRTPDAVAEHPGSPHVDHDHADELADSFPGSDPPAHY